MGKGHGGLYRYYRCSQGCGEKYLQEKALAEQLVALLAPVSLAQNEANELRRLIEADSIQNAKEVEKEVSKTAERLAKIQDELTKLTRSYIKDILDDDAYREATEQLMLEKASLKKLKTTYHRKGMARWIEPALEVIKALESAGKQQSEQSFPEIATLTRKIQLNPLLSRKKVTAGLAEPFLGIAQIIPVIRGNLGENQLPHGDGSETRPVPQFSLCSNWCPGQDSNLHALRHTPLKRVCLPIPPPGQKPTREGAIRGIAGAL